MNFKNVSSFFIKFLCNCNSHNKNFFWHDGLIEGSLRRMALLLESYQPCFHPRVIQSNFVKFLLNTHHFFLLRNYPKLFEALHYDHEFNKNLSFNKNPRFELYFGF